MSSSQRRLTTEAEARVLRRAQACFVMFADHHHDDRLACWCAASPLAQRAAIRDHPQRYFYPPYVGHRGWLDVPVDWDEIGELVVGAYRMVAPKRALAELDALERPQP